MNPIRIADWESLDEGALKGALVGNTDIVVARHEGKPYALYGRCLHRGALLADGSIQGQDIICGLHGWDYRVTTGISAYNNSERLPTFRAWIEDGTVLVDADEVADWEARNPQPYARDDYQGSYQDHVGAPEEPHTGSIHAMADGGLKNFGKHGAVSAASRVTGSRVGTISSC
jgi:methylamine---glutamate N-methyltransferase subunit C